MINMIQNSNYSNKIHIFFLIFKIDYLNDTRNLNSALEYGQIITVYTFQNFSKSIFVYLIKLLL